MRIFLIIIGFPRILDQGRDRHRSDSTWSWRYCHYGIFQIFEVSISFRNSIDESTSNINDDRILCHHISSEESWMASSDDDYIRFFRNITEIFGLTIAAYDRSSGIDEHECHRLSDDI